MVIGGMSNFGMAPCLIVTVPAAFSTLVNSPSVHAALAAVALASFFPGGFLLLSAPAWNASPAPRINIAITSELRVMPISLSLVTNREAHFTTYPTKTLTFTPALASRTAMAATFNRTKGGHFAFRLPSNNLQSHFQAGDVEPRPW